MCAPSKAACLANMRQAMNISSSLQVVAWANRSTTYSEIGGKKPVVLKDHKYTKHLSLLKQSAASGVEVI